jgi:hypothetical protein
LKSWKCSDDVPAWLIGITIGESILHWPRPAAGEHFGVR